MATPRKIKSKRHPKTDFICGIELELAYNPAKINISKAGYHSSRAVGFGTRFIAESDSSIHNHKWDYGSNRHTAEIISKPFLASDYKNVLHDFKNTVVRMSNCSRLNDVINFPQSSGAHIHITPVQLKNLHEKNIHWKQYGFKFSRAKTSLFSMSLNMKTIMQFRCVLKSKVKANCPDVYDDWVARYNRSYAKTTNNFREHMETRNGEWNTADGYVDDNRAEFRAFTLNGVTTWTQFFKMYDCLFETIYQVLGAEYDLTKPFHEEFVQQIDVEIEDPYQQITFESTTQDYNALNRDTVFEIPINRPHNYLED